MTNRITIKARVRHVRMYYFEGYNDVEIEVEEGSSLEGVESAILEASEETAGDIRMHMKGAVDEPDYMEIEWEEDPVKTIQRQHNAAGP